MDKIDYCLEVLEGLIIVFLNFDCVIDIICYDDDFKKVLMFEDWGKDYFKVMDEVFYVLLLIGVIVEVLSLMDVQVEVILNMCLCSLCCFEEMELVNECNVLQEECVGLVVLLFDEVL